MLDVRLEFIEDERGRLKALRQHPVAGLFHERFDGKSAFKQAHDHAESVSTKRLVLVGDAFPYPTSHAVDVLDGKVSEKLSVGFGHPANAVEELEPRMAVVLEQLRLGLSVAFRRVLFEHVRCCHTKFQRRTVGTTQFIGILIKVDRQKETARRNFAIGDRTSGFEIGCVLA